MRRVLPFIFALLTAGSVHAADDPIGRALALLGSDAPTTPITVVHRPASSFGTRSFSVAWTDGTTIFVYDRSDAFKRAAKGDARPLAAAIAHEAFHVAHGPAEPPAYAEQLRVLRRLGARQRDIQAVERAARQFDR